LFQEAVHFVLQGRQVGFNDAPDDVVGDIGVAVDQVVSEGSDPLAGGDRAGQTRLQTQQLFEGFADGDELPLHSGAKQWVCLIDFESFSLSELLNEAVGGLDVEEIFPVHPTNAYLVS